MMSASEQRLRTELIGAGLSPNAVSELLADFRNTALEEAASRCENAFNTIPDLSTDLKQSSIYFARVVRALKSKTI